MPGQREYRLRSTLVYGILGVAVAFLLAANPVVVNAAGQIGSSQIKNNSIKSKDLKDNQIKSADVKDGALGSVDLALEARGAKVFRYPVAGAHDFASEVLLCADIPVTAAEVRSR